MPLQGACKALQRLNTYSYSNALLPCRNTLQQVLGGWLSSSDDDEDNQRTVRAYMERLAADPAILTLTPSEEDYTANIADPSDPHRPYCLGCTTCRGEDGRFIMQALASMCNMLGSHFQGKLDPGFLSAK